MSRTIRKITGRCRRFCIHCKLPMWRRLRKCYLHICTHLHLCARIRLTNDDDIISMFHGVSVVVAAGSVNRRL